MKFINRKNIIISILGISIYIYTFAINVSTDKNTYSEATNYTNVQPGLWFDPGRSGHGFAIEPIGFNDLYFTVFFTYKDDGTPEWYTSLTTLENGVLNINLENNTLKRFNYDFSINPEGQGAPNILDESIGNNMLSIDFNSTTIANNDACNDTTNRATELVALATWQLGEQPAVSWCIQPIISLENYPKPDFGGIWWTGADDTGWGISIAFTNDNIIVIVYYYDADGTPRWVFGQAADFEIGQEISVNLLEYHGYARNAEPVATTNVLAGTITLNLNSNTRNLLTDGMMDIDISYQGSQGSQGESWTRTDMPIANFTQSHDLKKFVTSFESVDDFSGFYITPQAYKGTAFHDLSDANVHSGTYAHKAWITGSNPPSTAFIDNNHRAYPTIQLQNTETGVFKTPLYITLWVWLDMELNENAIGEDDWFSFATFTDDETDNWSRTVLVNLGHEGFVHLMHTTDQGIKEHIFQTTDIAFPQKQWVELKIYLYFGNESYAKVWQDGQLVSHAYIGNIENQLAQAHFGFYSAPQIESGVVYNDDLTIEMVDKE